MQQTPLSEMQENIILYDALSITSKIHSSDQIISLLGLDMPGINFEQTKGAHGYMHRLYWSCISIHYGGTDDMGVWLEMTGQGCRAFETYGSGDYERIFDEVFSNPGEMKITRLDVAFDDHTCVLDIDQLCSDTVSGQFVSRFNDWQVMYGSKGNSLTHGSMKSEIFLRIYDKARERGFTDCRHWIRVELQLRRDRAMAFLMEASDIGDRFCGVLLNYLRYVVPIEEDSNKWRWPLKDYWAALMGSAVAISIYQKPGAEYNIANLDRFVFNQAGNAVDCAIQIYGVEKFLDLLKKRESLPNPKYARLLEVAKVGTYEDFK